MGCYFLRTAKKLNKMILHQSDTTSVGFFTDSDEYWGFKYDYSYCCYSTNSIKNEIAVSDIFKYIKRVK